jgi:DNA-binding CsgD family transcriptional regulator
MSLYQELNRAITLKFSDKITSSCRVLFESLNVSQFYYCRIFNDGGFYNLDSNPLWAEHFISEKLYLIYPYFCAPQNQHAGISIFKESQNMLLEKVIEAGRRFDIQLKIRFVIKTDDGMEEYGFASGDLSENQESIFLNEIPLLRLFCQKFKMENKYLFSCLEDSKINIAGIIGPSFYKDRIPQTRRQSDKKALLKNLGIDFSDALSSRELEIIKLILKGYSAGKIATQVFLSKRTIEHHIERIKGKLSCFSKTELVQKARELEYLNLLSSFCNEW